MQDEDIIFLIFLNDKLKKKTTLDKGYFAFIMPHLFK